MTSSGEQELIYMRIPRNVFQTSGVTPRTMPRHSAPMISVTIREGWIHSPMLNEDGEELELVFNVFVDQGFITLSLADVRVVGPESSEASGGSARPESSSSKVTRDHVPTATPPSPSVTRPGASSPTRRSEPTPYPENPPPKKGDGKGTCQECRRKFALTKDGFIYSHGARNPSAERRRCLGSGDWPEEFLPDE